MFHPFLPKNTKITKYVHIQQALLILKAVNPKRIYPVYVWLK